MSKWLGERNEHEGLAKMLSCGRELGGWDSDVGRAVSMDLHGFGWLCIFWYRS